jgi:hypothetical protein
VRGGFKNSDKYFWKLSLDIKASVAFQLHNRHPVSVHPCPVFKICYVFAVVDRWYREEHHAWLFFYQKFQKTAVLRSCLELTPYQQRQKEIASVFFERLWRRPHLHKQNNKCLSWYNFHERNHYRYSLHSLLQKLSNHFSGLTLRKNRSDAVEWKH